MKEWGKADSVTLSLWRITADLPLFAGDTSGARVRRPSGRVDRLRGVGLSGGYSVFWPCRNDNTVSPMQINRAEAGQDRRIKGHGA